MKKYTFLTIAALITGLVMADPVADRDWATRIPCELQNAKNASLMPLEWLQGTTPLLSLDQFRSGRAVQAESNITAVVYFAPTIDSQYWVVSTNYATVANGYLVQMPTIATNTATAPHWYYTAIFYRNGHSYWTGSGRLVITPTTVTGSDGLIWQDISSFGGVTMGEFLEHTGNAAIHLTPAQAIKIDAAITSAPPQSVVSVNGQTGAVVITAADIGAVTNELDLRAMRLYHYGSPDIVESPAEWFTFVGGVVYKFHYEPGRERVVIPWHIGGLTVYRIGSYAFAEPGAPIVSLKAPRSVKEIEVGALESCQLLQDIVLPGVRTVGLGAFSGCRKLGAINLGRVESISSYAFSWCEALQAVYFEGDCPAEVEEDGLYNGSPGVMNYVLNATAKGWGETFGGRPVVRLPLHADSYTLAGETITQWPTAGISQAEADGRYLSSTPGWFWQGSQAVTTNDWAPTASAGVAIGAGVNNFELVPYTTSRHSVTGTVIITSDHYIVGVGVDWHIAQADDPRVPKTPMRYSSERIDGYTWELSANCSDNPNDGNAWYYAYASNVVVMTYDRLEMTPGLYTNDAAGVVARVDNAPLTISTTNGNSTNPVLIDDARRTVNAGTMEAYVDARKTEIADKAWRRTPSGKDAPSPYTVTFDQPIVQQGQMSYLNSGDYYAISYQGGDWYNVATGSVWRIGPGGSAALEIASTNRILHIRAFQVSGGYATLDISTNWVQNTPIIEFTDSLENPQWLECPEISMTNKGDHWRGVCPAVAGSRFFRAVDRQGDNVIRSHYTHDFRDGIILFGRRFDALADLKAALEELD